MNLIIISITTLLMAFPAKSSAASTLAAPPLVDTMLSASVVYKNTLTEKPMEGKASLNQLPTLGNVASTILEIKHVNCNPLSMETSRSGLVSSKDSLSFKTYAPMQSVNNTLSVAGTLLQSQLNDSFIAWTQVLSLIAKKQVNTELSYSMKTNGRGKLDSSIVYRLNPDTNPGKSDVMASIRYSIKF
ncbi:MAG: hypothetical protein HY306_08805 [Nitrosomonadales bacterium]|nr:hypothetical protein [Nitrosomonadales bacterium]